MLPNPPAGLVRTLEGVKPFPNYFRLQNWLRKNGRWLHKLHTDGVGPHMLLPLCPNLRDLALLNCPLSPQVYSSIAAATGLTRLLLDGVRLPDEPGVDQLLAAVTSLTALRHLKFGLCKHRGSSPSGPSGTDDVLTQLPPSFCSSCSSCQC